jgi:hypothetical protein
LIVRAELCELDRAAQTAEWVTLAERRGGQSAQLAPIESKREDGRGHRPEGGQRLAARELGVPRRTIERSIKIAGIVPVAQRAAGLRADL